MRGVPNTQYAHAVASDSGAAGEAATVTIAASETQRWVIDKIMAGYDTTLAAPVLITITAGGSTVCKIPVGTDGAVDLDFDDGILSGGQNEEVVVTLPAVAGKVATLYVIYH